MPVTKDMQERLEVLYNSRDKVHCSCHSELHEGDPKEQKFTRSQSLRNADARQGKLFDFKNQTESRFSIGSLFFIE